MAQENFIENTATSVNKDIPFWKKYPTPIYVKGNNVLPSPLLTSESFNTYNGSTLSKIAMEISMDRKYVNKILEKRGSKNE